MKEALNQLAAYGLTRRGFIAGAGTASVVALVGCGDGGTTTTTTPPVTTTPTITDVDILNFALNLEYLEAEFYLRAATGSGLGTADGGGETVTGGAKVTFSSSYLQQIANELAATELAHVRAIRSTITSLGGTPVAAPAIDFTDAFNAVATAAGIPGGTFNPFGDQISFLVGGAVFEDVGVSAYTGAAGAISSKTVLSAAAGIQAVEAYHAGTLRNLISYGSLGSSAGMTALTNFNLVVKVRGSLSTVTETPLSAGSGTANSSGVIGSVTPASIVNCDANALAYSRTTSQVLHIVYATPTGTLTASGGFFPSGMNGNIKTPTT